MRFYVKAYVYIIDIVYILLASVLFATLLVIGLNNVPFKLESLGIWVNTNLPLLALVLLSALLTFWQKLMPSLRTIFCPDIEPEDGQVLRNKHYRRLLVLLTAGVLLLSFAVFGSGGIFQQLHLHSARYGYVGDMFLLIGVLGLIANFLRPERAPINADMFVSDSPADSIPLSQSQEQATRYLAKILHNGLPQSIALTGDWGSGKTLVYQRAKKCVAEERKDVIWVDFDPWRYASEEALVKGFYESIAREIDQEVPGLQGAFRKIAQGAESLVAKGDSTGILGSLISSLEDIFTSNTSPDAVIKSLLEREGKRLVITLDNLERQYDPERAYRALQLVHHARTMGGDRVQILCIFEKGILLRAAPLHVASEEEYLEKFSEIEISVPPPLETSLRAQLDQLLDNPAYSKRLPGDFNLEVSNAGVKDIRSHRGIVRAFNELIMEFISAKDRSMKLDLAGDSDQRVTYVSYSDRFMMGHIKLKYPLIFNDIATNRWRYTQSRGSELSIRHMMMGDDEERHNSVSHFEKLFDTADIHDEQREVVKDLLVDLFPSVKKVFEPSSGRPNEDQLRRERRVGNRDVLDAYFALTQSQDAYMQHEGWIAELLENIERETDEQMIGKFELYMNRARADNSKTDSVTLLRNELLERKHSAYQMRALRAWLRACLRSEVNLSEEENRALGRIISALNEVALRQQPEQRFSFGQRVLGGITNYLSDPRSGLLLLLFLLPERGNQYLTDYINEKGFSPRGLYYRVLKWTEDYLIENEVDIFTEYSYEDYSFILYQLALSIRSGNHTYNTSVPGAAGRYKRVNEYAFKLLNANHKAAYEFIIRRFWVDKDDMGDSNGFWRVDYVTMAPYDPDQMLALVNSLKVSPRLTYTQKKIISSSIKKFEALIQNLRNNPPRNR